MGFDTTDEERAFWDDEPRRPRRRHTSAPEASGDRPTGRHPALSPRAASIAASRTSSGARRPGTRRHGDPTGTIPAVAATPATAPATPLPDIWDDHWHDDWHEPRDDRRDERGRTPAVDLAPQPTASRPPSSRRDVVRLRLGLLAAASVVLVPVAFALDGSDEGLRTSTPAAAVMLPDGGLSSGTPTIAPASADVVGDPTTAAAATDPSPGDGAAASPTVASAGPVDTLAPAGDPASTGSDGEGSDIEGADTPITTASATEARTDAAPEALVPEAPVTEAPTTEAPTTAAPSTAATTTTLDPAAAHAAAVAACGNTYEIAPGDYWIGLADAIDLSLAELLALNAATVDTPLYAGRQVCLPAGAHIATTTTAAATTTTAAPTTTAKPTTTTSPKSTTTTAAPATTSPKTTTTTAAPPKNTYTKAEVEAIIREVWPDDLEDEAVRIATRESNLIPTVRNYCCYGLFQLYWSVHSTWLAQMGVTSAAQLYDPRVNATAAYALYQRSGSWAPWAL